MLSDWVSFLAYPNLFGIKGFVVVVVAEDIYPLKKKSMYNTLAIFLQMAEEVCWKKGKLISVFIHHKCRNSFQIFVVVVAEDIYPLKKKSMYNTLAIFLQMAEEVC
jgi:hypothetical protein